MSRSVVSRRYARALIELAAEQGEVEAVGRGLAEVVEAITTDKEVRAFFFSPIRRAGEKRPVLERVLAETGAGGLLRRFLLLLLAKDRLPQVREIHEEYVRAADERSRRAEAVVRSAVPLDAASRERLAAKLETLTGKQVYLRVEEDPSLLGGVVARIGSVVYDGSIRSRMAKLKEQIVKG